MSSLISIIVPVYNAQDHLEECIKSLVEQSYENKEIILVDDGSKDFSGEICDRFAERYENIRVFHTENQGVAKARNLGIEKALGDYFVFVDSDDVLCEEFLEKTHFAMIENGVDYVSCSFSRYENDAVGSTVDYFFEDTALLTIAEYLGRMADFQAGAFWGANWGKLFKASIIRDNNIRFEPQIQFAEDFRFNLEYLKYIKSIYHIHKPLYIYRIDTSGSLSKSKRDSNKFWDEYYELYLRYVSLYERHGVYDKNKEKLEKIKDNAAKLVLRNNLRQNNLDFFKAKKVLCYIKKNPASANIKCVGLLKLYFLELRFKIKNRGR